MNNIQENQLHRRCSLFHPQAQYDRSMSPQKYRSQSSSPRFYFDSADYYMDQYFHNKKLKEEQEKQEKINQAVYQQSQIAEHVMKGYQKKSIIKKKNNLLLKKLQPQRTPLQKYKIVFDSADYFLEQEHQNKLKQKSLKQIQEITNQEELKDQNTRSQIVKKPKKKSINPVKHILNTQNSNESLDKIQSYDYKNLNQNHNLNLNQKSQILKHISPFTDNKQQNCGELIIQNKENERQKIRQYFDSADYFVSLEQQQKKQEQQDIEHQKCEQTQQQELEVENQNQNLESPLDSPEQNMQRSLQRQSEKLEKQFIACEKQNFAKFLKKQSLIKNKKKQPFDSVEYFLNIQKNKNQNNNDNQCNSYKNDIYNNINDSQKNLIDNHANEHSINQNKGNNEKENFRSLNISQKQKQQKKRKTLIDISWKKTCFDSAEYFMQKSLQSQKQQQQQQFN